MLLRVSIERVSSNRMPNGGKVNTDLVRPTSNDLDTQQGKAAKLTLYPEEGVGLAPMLCSDGHPLTVLRVAPDRCFNGAFGYWEVAFYECQIAFDDGVFLELLGQV